MTELTPEQTVDEFIRRVVAGDFERACELVAADIEYDNVPVGKNIGPEALQTFLQMMMGGVAEVQFITHRQTVAGNTVMNERTDRFRIGEAWIDLPVAGVFVVGDDGLITLWRDYFDMAMFTNEMARVTAG